MFRKSSFKSVVLSSVSAFLAATLALLLFRTGSIDWLQFAFVHKPNRQNIAVDDPAWWTATLLLGLAGLTASLVVERLGVRKALACFGGGFLALAILSLIASRVLSLDVLFAPTLFATTLGVILIQGRRLWQSDKTLTAKLIDSSSKSNPNPDVEAGSRLMTGLKLLDTVLSPQEAVVFQSLDGALVPAARLRAANGDPDSTRNSVWRQGIGLCEEAIRTRQIAKSQTENSESSSDLALPLTHENRAVGALLLRVDRDCTNEELELLSAVGGQMARNLQREGAQTAPAPGRTSHVSSRGHKRQLELIDVLNSVLTEQRFAISALSEITDGLAIGYLDGTLAYVNPAFCQFANLRPDQIAEHDIFSLLSALRTSVFDEPALAVRRVLQTGDAYERELQVADREETLGLKISLVLGQSTDIKESREPLCLVVSLRDLTRHKELEQMKSDMISLMSHELRTPITSINGFSELLIADDQLPAPAKEFVNIIASESQRLTRMINTFLAVTQLERKDKQEVLKIPLKLDDVVRETILNLQPLAKKKRIRLVEQPAQRIPPVAADKSLISQAVQNLVSNAIKYSPERTTVTVSTALEAEEVRVSVEDRGFGIPPEAVDRVWEKFYRVARDEQDKDDESTGLGLSFVREVVEQHGGTVGLETEVGRGSRFSFTLPRL